MSQIIGGKGGDCVSEAVDGLEVLPFYHVSEAEVIMDLSQRRIKGADILVLTDGLIMPVDLREKEREFESNDDVVGIDVFKLVQYSVIKQRYEETLEGLEIFIPSEKSKKGARSDMRGTGKLTLLFINMRGRINKGRNTLKASKNIYMGKRVWYGGKGICCDRQCHRYIDTISHMRFCSDV